MNIITDNNFIEAISEDGILVMDCWAEWCQPCKALKPILEELEKELNDVRFGEINIEHNRVPTVDCGVMSLPTLLIFKDGGMAKRVVGSHNIDVIRREIREVMN
jgi:thioredoxin 1